MDVAEWDPGGVVESRWRARTISEFGTREVKGSRFVSRVVISLRLTFDHRDSGFVFPGQHRESRDIARSDLPIARTGEIAEKTVGRIPEGS